MTEDTEENIHKKTAYHGGFSYLERIDRQLKALNHARLPQPEKYEDIIGGFGVSEICWRFELLKGLFQELYPKMDEALQKEHRQNQSDIGNEVNNVRRNVGKKGFSTPILTYLDDWELMLRQIVNDKGLLMPSKQDGSDAAGGKD